MRLNRGNEEKCPKINCPTSAFEAICAASAAVLCLVFEPSLDEYPKMWLHGKGSPLPSTNRPNQVIGRITTKRIDLGVRVNVK